MKIGSAAALPLPALVLAKMLAHWLLTALPLILASPILAVMLSMSMEDWLRAMLSLALGTPALVAFGTLGAAVTVSLKRGGLIAPVLILPLCVPVLIFGVGAIAGLGTAQATVFLAAISLLTTAFSPFFAALALQAAED